MKKAYLLSFSDMLTSHQVKKMIDSMPEVINWRYDMGHSVYLISEHSAKQLGESFRTHNTGNRRFIITEITDNTWGWLTKESWYLIKHKTHKAKD